MKTETNTKREYFSEKRLAMLELIRSTEEHPSADWIYSRLQPRFPNLSLATVYRNLARFKEQGLIIGVGSVDGHERYDAKTFKHGHFFCKGCGAVIDVIYDEAETGFVSSIAEKIGAVIDDHELKLYGYCKNCSIEKSQD